MRQEPKPLHWNIFLPSTSSADLVPSSSPASAPPAVAPADTDVESSSVPGALPSTSDLATLRERGEVVDVEAAVPDEGSAGLSDC